ncbi:MAG: hypothetical protein IKQ79_00285 [Bacteroidales bacterium]|nr:hypothetical protein [Bacteroidales bacterium]
MGIIDKENALEHPNGKIKLLNGTVLDCYPLEQPEDKTDNAMKLDTTGTYLVVGGKKPAEASRSDEEREEEEKLFLNNAFRFLQHRDRIMSDSRMFLCPVPIQSGIAYTGTSGFQRPTLGIYLELWLNCERASLYEEDGTKQLVYHIAGSPLSGNNHCAFVDANGKTELQSIASFISLWPTFIDINCRYDKAKDQYQAYTLKQVVEILDKENLSLNDDMEMEILFLKSALCRQKIDRADEKKRLERTIDKLKNRLFYDHRDELEAIIATYNEKIAQKEKREKEIDEECKELRRKLKSGEIDNKQYQKQLTPLKKEMEDNKDMPRNYQIEALRTMFPGLWCIDFDDVKQYCEDPRSVGPLQP